MLFFFDLFFDSGPICRFMAMSHGGIIQPLLQCRERDDFTSTLRKTAKRAVSDKRYLTAHYDINYASNLVFLIRFRYDHLTLMLSESSRESLSV